MNRSLSALLLATVLAAPTAQASDLFSLDTLPSPQAQTEPARPERGRSAEARPVYGTVTAIETGERASESTRAGKGALIGGAIGALIGRQMTENKTTGTVLGGAIGAWAGHEIEKRNSSKRKAGVTVTVALDGGGVMTLPQDQAGDLRIGDRVRVDNDRLSRVASSERVLQSSLL